MVSKSLFPEIIKKRLNRPTQKLIATFVLIILYRIGNEIPLTGIDQEALKKAFFQSENKNALLQVINMYSGGGGSNAVLTPFSLGIIPFINASIFVDLLTTLIPSFQKLQQEEGEAGRRTLNFYKKGIAVVFAIIQTVIVLGYLKPYMYNTGMISLWVTGMTLASGAMLIVWMSNQFDNKGVGNGTSIIILINIVTNLSGNKGLETLITNPSSDLLFLLVISGLILISQSARIDIPLVSARQLSYIGNLNESKENEGLVSKEIVKRNNLSVRFNQAGIFPIIIASNVLPFLNYLVGGRIPKLGMDGIYYLLIITFNYFYTIVFWDPEKISEELRKSSVAIQDVPPGEPTAKYLGERVKGTSTLGGIGLCAILIIFDLFKFTTKSVLLTQLNVSSLMIVIGVTYELQKTIRALYKNILS